MPTAADWANLSSSFVEAFGPRSGSSAGNVTYTRIVRGAFTASTMSRGETDVPGQTVAAVRSAPIIETVLGQAAGSGVKIEQVSFSITRAAFEAAFGASTTPAVGDQIIDEHSVVWPISDVIRECSDTLYRCVCRRQRVG